MSVYGRVCIMREQGGGMNEYTHAHTHIHTCIHTYMTADVQ